MTATVGCKRLAWTGTGVIVTRMQCNRALSYIVIVAAVAGAGPVGGFEAHADPSAAVDETQRTEAALKRVDDHWGDAETDGDVAYLEQLLVPEYRSIDPKGGSHVRAMILDHARRNRGHAAEARKVVDAYKQAHPTEMMVIIHGDVGIVSYFDPRRGADSSIRGSDFFIHEGNRWHAVYSLHNGAE
jgi:hypothetical protein